MKTQEDHRDDISGVILAGGLGRRMGQRDKGWMSFQGRPLIAHVLERFRPQVDKVIISANRNRERYETLGYTVVADMTGDFSGPLAGWQAVLRATKTSWLASVPCDSPRFPDDLVARLYRAAIQKSAPIAIACTQARAHPVFALLHRDLLTRLTHYLENGGRRVETWCRDCGAAEAIFDDQQEAFDNINTENDLWKNG
ncbi:MAG: molybdenum cofactor guanylyltransferase [Burkholderiales bacterium]|jgi:molybdopterin-guanine dinucleotide biosynthesis protein A|nr:molybdenum cofactor guanylyltransferase [Burkholderiales bacterium]